ncbi:MAG: 5-formyltetrahydrofolate cyclo-ligase [Methylomonas sp.]|jgi:5-formyltetrahydrofolate cyclo-ligase|uniref:5-formyltetrahydrofolate cyclo-ligase n=1 Tax=Methylomonas sp. TaxID=418 RepID=UPI0025E54032|nr:5-formyltetrahydrofolate cyclo-ligase [Methylomonas sp.]MCK9606824.1 5-formyltetrahydrofolate cyclo-ligase [Methylomonas sp.]
MDKQQQRQLAYAARNAQPDKQSVSNIICRRVVSEPWYQQADTILWYLHCRSEVRTLPVVTAQLFGAKRIVVPYCTVDEWGNKCLGLWHLNAIEELRPGMWNILEPPRERWLETDKRISPTELDAVIVPGVAFDSLGGRLGNGAGYYDRLLSQVRADTVLAGVCYQSQLLAHVDMQSHDVYMDLVVTERTVYPGKRRTL